MNLDNILNMLKDNMMFALSITILIILVSLVSYIIRSRKKSNRDIPKLKRSFIVFALFTFYIVTVLALTLLNRGSHYGNVANLALFSSYIEAWHTFSLRGWQLLYFNIMMFIPFGFLLPLLHQRFTRIGVVFLLSLLFTACIETIQFVTRVGIFELDDVLNNVLGALIGFGLLKVWQLRKFNMKTMLYLLPIFVVIIGSAIMFTYYYTKELGNLNIIPATKVDMKNVVISTDVVPSKLNGVASIYKAPTITKAEARQLADRLFSHYQVDTKMIETIPYQTEINYRYYGDPSYFIFVSLLDGSFNITDFSSFDEHVARQDEEEMILKQKLASFGITVDENADFSRIDTGQYKWEINYVREDLRLINGQLRIDYYNDGTIKQLAQNIVTYKKVRDVDLISEEEAYNVIVAGKFKHYKSINHIQVKQITLSYMLDTKGYYQPIYNFECFIDGHETVISIPAIG